MDLVSWFGFITGVICVYLIVKENDWNWSIGIINSLILLYVFLNCKLYAQVGLQALYVLEGGYGWYKWLQKDKVTNTKLIKINHSKRKQVIGLLLLGIISTPILTIIFMKTGDVAPFIDSLVAVLSVLAELMLCFKICENWSVYIVSDVILIGLLFSQGLYIMMFTYIVFLGLCVMGLVQWGRKYKLYREVNEWKG